VLAKQRIDGLASLEWTLNAYILSFACLLLTGAALGDRFGRRRMFVVGVLVFTAASAAALSPSAGALIAARVLQGAGAAMVFPLTLKLISEAFPVERRGAAIGLWGGVAGLAVAAGPLLGGVSSTRAWRRARTARCASSAEYLESTCSAQCSRPTAATPLHTPSPTASRPRCG
jgi:MFS family permease